MIDDDALDTRLKKLLADVLGLEEEETQKFDRDTELFGAIPEFDSMSIAGLLTEMEDRFDIEIDDDEVEGEIFETYGNFHDFAVEKTGG